MEIKPRPDTEQKEQSVSEETIKGQTQEALGGGGGEGQNLMLASVSEILASTPTIKPEITTEEEAWVGEIKV